MTLRHAALLAVITLSVSCYEMVIIDTMAGDPDGGTPDNPTATGVDLLLVIDNSISMAEEQETTATAIYALLGALFYPAPRFQNVYPPVDALRIGVVSSDMGLQWGEDRSIESVGDLYVENCSPADRLRGDDGALLTTRPSVVSIGISSYTVPCHPGEDLCPDRWSCSEGGFCVPDSDDHTVPCDMYDSAVSTWIDSSVGFGVARTANRAACAVQRGTDGCGIEQPLEAAVRGLERQPEFLDDHHVLTLLFVSDEDDCSIRDSAFFETEAYMSGTLGYLAAACQLPLENQANLFPTDRYYETFVQLKDGNAGMVVFAAAVGVPVLPEPICEGTGTQLAVEGCLAHETMQLEIGRFPHPTQGTLYYDLVPACERSDSEINRTYTFGRPARRFVETAMRYEGGGYIFSICRDNWSPAMLNIADIIHRRISASTNKI